MYVCALSSTHCSPISDQGTWSCGCNVGLSISRNVPLHTHVQDETLAVWEMISPMDIILRKVLKGHTGPVYAVDFDEKYIVSGSADRTIKVHMCGRRRGQREEGTEGEVGRGRRGGEELVLS